MSTLILMLLSSGSSPHTRGARCRLGKPFDDSGIIPAYAGSTGCNGRGVCVWRDHPRIRGEHDEYKKAFTPVKGSSPHTRGALEHLPSVFGRAGIIPAYAGSTEPRRSERGTRRDHLRIRGEHTYYRDQKMYDEGSSPHTRGALVLSRHRLHVWGIIPAYAGSTGPTSTTTATPRDHPRIRGEHCLHRIAMSGCLGSSPHTRGARRHRHRGVLLPGIIPAYAGSTSQS